MENQKKTVRTDISINGTQATYSFRHEGLISGTYAGQFVFKCILLPLERLAAARDRRMLLGEYGILASDYEKQVALAISELAHRVVSAPPFWKTEDMFQGNIADQDLLFKVLDAALDAEVIFVDAKRAEREKLLKSALETAEKVALEQEEQKAEEKDEEEDDEA